MEGLLSMQVQADTSSYVNPSPTNFDLDHGAINYKLIACKYTNLNHSRIYK